MSLPLAAFIAGLPKAELHMHLEGSLEPEMMFALAKRNQVKLPYPDVEAIRAAYDFKDLQSFLDLYYAGAAVLQIEEDFYELTRAYVEKAMADNVRHAEIFFDPQTHTARGIPITTVFSGIARALREAKQKHGFSAGMILCFLRHLSEEDALLTLASALPLHSDYADLWNAVGLDSSEMGNPPEKFARVFAKAQNFGLHLVAHAGEEGPAEYVRNSLDILEVERIDHGVKAESDPELVKRLVQNRIPLTVCPLSNLKLCGVKQMQDHNLARLLKAGLCVTVNSDDPAYFGGYINRNYLAVAEALNLSRENLVTLAKNSFEASFVSEEQKRAWLDEIDRYVAG